MASHSAEVLGGSSRLDLQCRLEISDAHLLVGVQLFAHKDPDGVPERTKELGVDGLGRNLRVAQVIGGLRGAHGSSRHMGPTLCCSLSSLS